MFSLHVYIAPCLHLVPEEARREHWIPWNWSYGWLRATGVGAGNQMQIPLEEQPGPLTADTSFYVPMKYF